MLLQQHSKTTLPVSLPELLVVPQLTTLSLLLDMVLMQPLETTLSLEILGELPGVTQALSGLVKAQLEVLLVSVLSTLILCSPTLSQSDFSLKYH
jgi:hypothetical protein